jgi:hypothetical protein
MSRWIARFVVVALALGTLAIGVVGSAQAAVTDAALAAHWAPIHYQDTDSSKYNADYLSVFDYDGDWQGLDNWNHLDAFATRLTGAVYFSVVENATTWYIVYAYYHPRDWSEVSGPWTHENDMEGLLEVVAKDGSTYGALRAMVTIAHSDFYSYIPPGSPYTSGGQSIDGTLTMQTYAGSAHPTTFQEAKGHGCFRWAGSFPGGDGLVYYPSGTGELPSGGNDRSVGYQLVDLFSAGGLWARRDNAETYASFGTFRGDDGEDNAANTPWGWDDHDDGGSVLRGDMAIDPAKLIRTYFANAGTHSSTYLRNPYQTR